MFVVRIENDEATTYRAFRRTAAAKAYAVEANRDDVDCLVDIFEASGTDDVPLAVATVRDGKARLVGRGEAMAARPAFVSESLAGSSLAI
jgi:hypothetical protein